MVVSCSVCTTWREASTSSPPTAPPSSSAPPSCSSGAASTTPTLPPPLLSRVTRTAAAAISNRAMQAMLFRATAATRVRTNTPLLRVSLTTASTVAGAVEMARAPKSTPKVQS